MSLLVSLLAVAALRTAPAALVAAPPDSIGVETRGGQRLVRHRVAQGETLTALSRRYHVTLAQLTAANPQLKNGLAIGQVVLVPRGSASAAAAPAPATAAKTAAGTAPTGGAVPARYVVAKGETLFGIARKFNLAPADLIRLNRLPAGGTVRVGQELLLQAAEAGSAPETTVVAAPVKTSAPAAPTPAAPAPAGEPVNPNKEAQVATVTPAVPDAPATKAAARDKDREKDREKDKTNDAPDTSRPDEPKNPTRASELSSRKVETGMAAVIDKSGTDKYLALHKTAPVGTIMQVKNAANGQSVYVRVIGQLPDTGENQNILVRLSPRAVQKLGTPDQRFRVETSYVP